MHPNQNDKNYNNIIFFLLGRPGWPRLPGWTWVAGWHGLAVGGEGFLPVYISELSRNYPGIIQELSGILPDGPACPAWLAWLGWLGPPRLAGLGCPAWPAGWHGWPGLAGLPAWSWLAWPKCFANMATQFVVFVRKTNWFQQLLMISCIDFENIPTPCVFFASKTNWF